MRNDYRLNYWRVDVYYACTVIVVIRLNDFGTQRYRDEVTLLKNIQADCCKVIGEGQKTLRLANSSCGINLSEGFNFGKIELAINLDGILRHAVTIRTMSYALFMYARTRLYVSV